MLFSPDLPSLTKLETDRISSVFLLASLREYSSPLQTEFVLQRISVLVWGVVLRYILCK